MARRNHLTLLVGLARVIAMLGCSYGRISDEVHGAPTYDRSRIFSSCACVNSWANSVAFFLGMSWTPSFSARDEKVSS